MFLSPGDLSTQGSNPDLPNCKQILYCLSYQGGPKILEWVTYPFSSGSSRPRNWTRISCNAYKLHLLQFCQYSFRVIFNLWVFSNHIFFSFSTFSILILKKLRDWSHLTIEIYEERRNSHILLIKFPSWFSLRSSEHLPASSGTYHGSYLQHCGLPKLQT